MRAFLVLAAVVIGAASLIAGYADRWTPAAANATQAKAHVEARSSPAGAVASARRVVIPSNSRHHFEVEASIGGRRVGFLVDTGASIVALNKTAARDLGISVNSGNSKVSLQTANGKVEAQRVRLPAISVGSLQVQNVDAVVLPDEALKSNLLGMTFLSRLTRYEFRSGQLILEQ